MFRFVCPVNRGRKQSHHRLACLFLDPLSQGPHGHQSESETQAHPPGVPPRPRQNSGHGAEDMAPKAREQVAWAMPRKAGPQDSAPKQQTLPRAPASDRTRTLMPALRRRRASWLGGAARAGRGNTPGLGADLIPAELNPVYLPESHSTNPPATPNQRAPDCTPDHGVTLCMISCWFSRHCFSLSSVSVSRCSRMHTVCNTTGQAQRARRLPKASCEHFPPRGCPHLWRLLGQLLPSHPPSRLRMAVL